MFIMVYTPMMFITTKNMNTIYSKIAEIDLAVVLVVDKLMARNIRKQPADTIAAIGGPYSYNEFR